MSVEDLRKALCQKMKEATKERLEAKRPLQANYWLGYAEGLEKALDLFSVFLADLADYDKQRKQLFGKCAYVDFEGKPAIVCNLCRFYHGLQKGCSWEEEKIELFEATQK